MTGSGVITAFAPGRVNLIGEHTDYNDGLALPFAIAAGVSVRGEPLRGGRVEVRADDVGEDDAFDLDDATPAEGWRAFCRGAVAELRRGGRGLRAARLTISGDVPRGGGLSSSAALEVALCLALLAVAGEPEGDRIELARICSRVENDWVGSETGLLDQLASLCARQDHAVRIDFRSMELTQVPLRLAGYRFVVLDSGETHDLADPASGYRQRRAECREACARLGISSLRDATLEQAQALPDPLRRRVRHVVSENARVDKAVAALHSGDAEDLGALLDASHASLRDDYEVSTEAVEATARRLRESGAVGARIVGGGFGGNVLALLPDGAEAPDGAVELVPGAGAEVART